MAILTPARREELHRRGLLLEWFTVAWNVIEAVVGIGVGLVVGSVALVGFGVDSGIEVISAVARSARVPEVVAGESGRISFFLPCGSLIPLAALRGIRPSETA